MRQSSYLWALRRGSQAHGSPARIFANPSSEHDKQNDSTNLTALQADFQVDNLTLTMTQMSQSQPESVTKPQPLAQLAQFLTQSYPDSAETHKLRPSFVSLKDERQWPS
jgi:hypothetical protein